MSKDTPLTITVPEAGKRYFGLCRNAAYDAAARGEIPTIKIGRLLRVPVRALEKMLDDGKTVEEIERLVRAFKGDGASTSTAIKAVREMTHN